MHDRPRRSVLYMPGANARALEKARTLPADGLILDLEDAVTPEAKPQARAQVVAAVRAGGYGRREVVVRVNGLDTPWGHADLTAAATCGADAVLLPKVETAEALRQAERVLAAAGAPESLALWVMVETPRGVLNVAEVAAGSPRLACLVMGTSDLAKDLRCAHTPDRLPFLTSFGLVLLAGRANGLAVLDGVHLDLDDAEGLAAACRQGRELGFDGKTLIHPNQIEAANRAFAPTPDEVARARRLIAAHAEATAAGKGITVVDGKLVEALHVEQARRLVALAEAVGIDA
ncbi:HpcH/HpaI aldolase/citrate lyase family protein [Rhodocista pekingensis]|uniref:HpcH/HpaI aldolase/citrate lyase family protein n=1 Tax=Rhodocista pekingensis TaxID=201185 RepID=A0ABW2KYZ3_9PROT